MTDPWPHLEIPQDGLIFTLNADGSEQTFARIDVTGLSYEQIASLRKQAKAMQEQCS